MNEISTRNGNMNDVKNIKYFIVKIAQIEVLNFKYTAKKVKKKVYLLGWCAL